jgi:hypothetical protein
LNGDGKWDASMEQLLFAPVLAIGEARYAARSDPYGKRLTLEPLTGTGTVRLAVAKRDGSPHPVELAATLTGRDGSAVGLSGERAMAIVPVGEYRLGTVTCAFQDPHGGPRWNYVFSEIGRRGELPWYKVEREATVVIDPIGTLEFKTGSEGEGPKKPGDELRVQPQLYTGDGMLIVTCYRGASANPASDSAGGGARIALVDAQGRPLATAHSGFA